MSASCIPDCKNNETNIDRDLRVTFEMENVLSLARDMKAFVTLCLHN